MNGDWLWMLVVYFLKFLENVLGVIPKIVSGLA